VFKKELLEIRKKMIWGLIIFCILAASLPLLYPMVTSTEFVPADDLNTMPSGFSKGVLIELIERMRNDYNFYLWSQWDGKNLPQAAVIMAIILGMGIVSNEYKRKTALFLLARPISRIGILGNKFAAGIISLAIIIFISTLTMLFTAWLTGKHFDWGTQMTFALPSFFGSVLVFAFTAFFSSFASGALAAAAGGLAVTVCSVLSSYFLKSDILNILMHMAGVRFFQEGVFPIPFIVTSTALTVVFFFLTLLLFSRREVV